MDTLSFLTDIIEKIKNEEHELDFNKPNQMVNLCSYFSMLIMRNLKNKNLICYNYLISIDSSMLPNNSYVFTMGESNHNVVYFNGFIIDITRKQFGSLIVNDIMTFDDYFQNKWIIKSKTISTKLNL